MDFLVMLEESSETSPVLARVDSVPAELASERRARDVVTLYGTPDSESLALALAAAVESHRTAGNGSGAFRHLGVWPERGAVGDAAWRDEGTGELVTRDLDIPFDVLMRTARVLLSECGSLLQRLVAGLAMPDWPEGTWRAINLSLDSVVLPGRISASRLEGLLDTVREADALTYEFEGD
ncbi:MAG TPA: hypothetical protein VFK13_11855 [Gemmatimonadaceae bacterium]|nr:hypothetical protein [Gemmatimonadaceae bacterium]